MDTLELIGSTMGLGFLAGIRLYATVFAVGLAIRFGWFHPGAGAAGLLVLAHPAVLTAAGVACVIEFFADKVPWLDSLWDSFHTVIRPIGAILLASAALGHFDPVVKTVLMLLCGGVALASTGAKASTRLAVNHSPEPFSNIALSLIEDAIIPFGTWISLEHPEIAAAFVSIFLAVFLWLAPGIFRSVRLRWIAVRVWLCGAPTQSGLDSDTRSGNGSDTRFGANGDRGPATASDLLPSSLGVHKALCLLADQAGPIPQAYARAAQRSLQQAHPPMGIHAAATRSIAGLGGSVGYLALSDEGLAFVTRRWFRKRTHAIRLSQIQSVELRRGILMNRLVVHTADGDQALYLFKNVQIAAVQTEAASAEAVASNA